MKRIQTLRRILIILTFKHGGNTATKNIRICYSGIIRLKSRSNEMFTFANTIGYISISHIFKLLGVKYSGGLKDLIFLD